jgi:hypothetical protein
MVSPKVNRTRRREVNDDAIDMVTTQKTRPSSIETKVGSIFIGRQASISSPRTTANRLDQAGGLASLQIEPSHSHLGRADPFGSCPGQRLNASTHIVRMPPPIAITIVKAETKHLHFDEVVKCA